MEVVSLILLRLPASSLCHFPDLATSALLAWAELVLPFANTTAHDGESQRRSRGWGLLGRLLLRGYSARATPLQRARLGVVRAIEQALPDGLLR